jgi:hypothetical protein
MKPTKSAYVVLSLLILHFAIADPESFGQGEHDAVYNAADSAQWMREANFAFSLSQSDDVDRLSKICRIAVLEATLALEKLSRNELTKDDDEPLRPARVLLMFKGGGRRGLTALCNHITLNDGRGDEAVPLSGFIIAQGLAGIGGTAVRSALLDSLHKTLDRKGLLIRAHVLAQMEPRSIMHEHLRLALEDQVQRERIFAVAVNETYKSNLCLMNEWLQDPEFLEDIKNWP